MYMDSVSNASVPGLPWYKTVDANGEINALKKLMEPYKNDW